MPKSDKKKMAKEIAEPATKPDNKFVITLVIHVKNAAGDYITDRLANVAVDTRSSGDEDPPDKLADGTGRAEFPDLDTTGSVTYDVYVDHPNFYPELISQYYGTGGTKNIYFYLEPL
ncbi:MAG: hypothetical protein KJ060_17415 [Candidatus Hydrogenedentes bacterium]|nr:hypothetical protein [Candidatus Hydrogenedentota bacterium]